MFGDEYYAANGYFSDSLEHLADSGSRFDAACWHAPDGWQRAESGGWVQLQPAGLQLPAQGWKVHVSSALTTADDVIGVVWDYCVRAGLAFKFLRSTAIAMICNGKQAGRASSGKLVTVYPADDRQLQEVLDSLGAALGECPGPYVLSDLRWRQGPLYLRYGGYLEVYCLDDDDEWVLALQTPEGAYVPDLRSPTFEIPPWAPVPGFVAAQIAAAAEDAPGAFPYEIKEALHFSNAGGIYKATDPSSGRVVVLREARPHAGLDGAGDDAVARLWRERNIMQRLAGLPVVPALVDHFTAWEHQFLVEEYVEGDTLHNSVASRYPFIYPAPSPADLAAYTAWAVATAEKIDEALSALHARGVVFADLNPRNVLLRPDGGVVLVDFEQSFTLDEDFRPTIGTQGFVASWARSGTTIDEYGMNCILLWIFMPMTPVLALHPAKAEQLVRTAAELFPLPDRIVARLLTGLRGPDAQRDGGTGPAVSARQPQRRDTVAASANLVAEFSAAEPDWDAVMQGMVRAIHRSATAGRNDRLFPGDPAQFADGALNIAYGAAGVLYTLWAVGVTGDSAYDRYVTWLLTALRRARWRRPGFYSGLHGVAYVLDRVGLRDEALNVLDQAMTATTQPKTVGLFNGLSGTGWVELYFARCLDDRRLWDAALGSGQRLAAALDGREGAGLAQPGRAGLLRGWSGPVMFFLSLYEATGDRSYLDSAREALGRDLARCDVSPGGLEVTDGKRWLTYVDGGSCGIGLAARRYVSHRDDDSVAHVPEAIRVALTAEYVVFPGFLNGRAGLLAALASLDGDDRIGRRAVDTQVRRLGWHAVPYGGGLAFPGDGLAKLSMDLGTGTAGVLLAVHAALHSTAAAEPLFGVQPGEHR